MPGSILLPRDRRYPAWTFRGTGLKRKQGSHYEQTVEKKGKRTSRGTGSGYPGNSPSSQHREKPSLWLQVLMDGMKGGHTALAMVGFCVREERGRGQERRTVVARREQAGAPVGRKD